MVRLSDGELEDIASEGMALRRRVDALLRAIDARRSKIKHLATAPAAWAAPAAVESVVLERVVRFLEAADAPVNLSPQPWEPCA